MLLFRFLHFTFTRFNSSFYGNILHDQKFPHETLTITLSVTLPHVHYILHFHQSYKKRRKKKEYIYIYLYNMSVDLGWFSYCLVIVLRSSYVQVHKSTCGDILSYTNIIRSHNSCLCCSPWFISYAPSFFFLFHFVFCFFLVHSSTHPPPFAST